MRCQCGQEGREGGVWGANPVIERAEEAHAFVGQPPEVSVWAGMERKSRMDRGYCTGSKLEW